MVDAEIRTAKVDRRFRGLTRIWAVRGVVGIVTKGFLRETAGLSIIGIATNPFDPFPARRGSGRGKLRTGWRGFLTGPVGLICVTATYSPAHHPKESPASR